MGWNAGDNDRNLFNYKRYLHMFLISKAELKLTRSKWPLNLLSMFQLFLRWQAPFYLLCILIQQIFSQYFFPQAGFTLVGCFGEKVLFVVMGFYEKFSY